jgi:steroid delta-isomerase-like uncharacterized protein
MTNQANLSLLRKLFDEVYTKGNLSLLDQLLTSDVKLFDPATPNLKGGLSSLKELETMYRTAFPNKTLRIDDIQALDNLVLVRWTLNGTHKGLLNDLPATGKSFKLSGLSYYVLKNGKIAEIYSQWDRLGLLEQLGLVESPLLALSL